MNARIVRTRATAIKPELDLIRKKCLKIVSLVISLYSVSGYFPQARARQNSVYVLLFTLLSTLF